MRLDDGFLATAGRHCGGTLLLAGRLARTAGLAPRANLRRVHLTIAELAEQWRYYHRLRLSPLHCAVRNAETLPARLAAVRALRAAQRAARAPRHRAR